MDKEKNIQDELKEQAPFLSQKLKETQGGFKVPDGYFDSLSDRILLQTKEEATTATVIQIPSNTTEQILPIKKKRPFRMVATAASIALIIVAGLWFIPKGTDTTNPFAELENYNEAEVLQFLDKNMDDIGFEHLVDSGILSEADLDFGDISTFSDEETDFYLESLLNDSEELIN